MPAHAHAHAYACAFAGCTKSFRKPSILELHENTHLGRRPYKCASCGKAYFKPSHLKVHVSVHHEESAHACAKCHKSLSSGESLKRHMDLCGRVFACPVCRKTYTRELWYHKHLDAHHKQVGASPRAAAAEKLHRCPVCAKAFQLKKNMRAHTSRVHSVPLSPG